MGVDIRVLIIEDTEDDALLLWRALRRGGYEVQWQRVDTAPAMKTALESQPWDVVVSDYSMPRFSATDALALLKESGLDLPFIIVSGAIGEGAAVEAMKAGAHDYVMKSNLARLVPAIERERREARSRAKRRAAEAALHESEERYALAAQGANDGLWDWDLKTDRIYFSARWKSMLGYAGDEVGDRPTEWMARVHPADVERLRTEIAAHLEGRSPHFESEHRLEHKDGRYRWVISRGLAVLDTEGTAYRMAGSLTDVSERKMVEERLVHDALHDSLTGLPNRTLFIDRLERLIQRAQRHPDLVFAVLWLDIDRFKVINDSLGHLHGDRLLIAIARRLEENLRAEDTLARLGGDEFSALVDEIQDLGDAIRIAERIQQALAPAFELDGHEVFVTTSIGIALGGPGYKRAEDLLRDADMAMYRAKGLGKSRHAVFDETLHARAVARLELETDLRHAVQAKAFRVHYQPIVRLDTGKLIGFEALVRWEHPERGQLSPGEFIPVAEDTGLIVAMGRSVLEQACGQLQAWQEEFDYDLGLSMSVNLSSRELTQPDLVKEVRSILRRTGLDGSKLRLEITESMLMENLDVACTVLTELRAMNICVSVDDFGTGYSSLNYLHRLPIDVLKIDRSFVAGLDVDEEHLAIVRAIVTLSQSLGMEVVAEGIETTEQCEYLKTLECQYGQGYLFSRPLDREIATALIADQLRARVASIG
jgi:diguanylate cyclase (GGDEF)-like protein/PAS domain S-box-containing protein